MKKERVLSIAVNADSCARCGRCARVCPSAVFAINEQDRMITVNRPQSCIQCGHCVDVCAKGALWHEAFPAEKVHAVNKDLLPSPAAVMELLKSRRSNRTITDQPIPESVRFIWV